MDLVVIGVDPHRRSVTIEARDAREVLRATGSFPTTTAGYRALLRYCRQWPTRLWAVEGAGGVGRPLAAGCSPRASGCWMCPRSCRPGAGARRRL